MLSKEALLYMKFSLKKFFMVTNSCNKLSEPLAKKVQQFETDRALGHVDEARFDALLFELLEELDEHMYMWKRALHGRVTDFIHQGPQFLLLISAPNIKTCISDVVALKHLIFPPSYHVKVEEKGSLIHYQMTHSDANTPIAHIKEDALIAVFLFVFREICGPDFDYTEMWFPKTRKPFDERIVKRATKAKVNFHDGPMTAVFNQSDYLKENYLYDGEVRAALQQSISIMYKKAEEDVSYTDKVVQLLNESEQPASLTAENVAVKLNTSTSTFRRNLSDENASFKELQGKVIDQLAFERLLTSTTKIDAIALELGYTERSSFERAFKNKFGTTPANLRAYQNQLEQSDGGASIAKLINTLPPLPESCRLLLQASDDENFGVATAVKIIERDPVFSGRVLGLANKAIYGKPPRDLADAIGRNIGLGNLKNLAVVFAANDSLANEITQVDLDKFIQSQILAPNIFKVYAKNLSVNKAQQATFDQLLTFGLLGLLILLHQKFNQNHFVMEIIKSSSGLVELMARMRAELDISLLGTTALLLSMWGVNSKIIKQINHLENKLAKDKPLSAADSVMLISFSSSLSLCLDLNFKAAIEQHAKRISKIEFEQSWGEAVAVIEKF